MIVAYNLFIREVVSVGKGGPRPEFCFPIWPYHSLPYLTPVMLKPLVFLVWSTNTYQPRDLSLGRPSICFTNHYHREGGQGIDLAVDQTDRMGRTVKGGWFAGLAVWPELCRVRMVAHHQEWPTPWWSVSERFSENIFLGRHANKCLWW